MGETEDGGGGMGNEVSLVHLRINTRVRVLGRLGCTGAFTRRTEQHARGPVKKSSSTIYS